jgi:hypothetical protein
MIKTILVPATGSDADAGVFASALTVARPFGAHLGFLHIRIDSAAFAATIMPEVSSPQVVTDLINRMEEEAEQREQKAKQLFESFCGERGWPPPEARPRLQRARQGGFGKSALTPIGLWNMRALPTFWSLDDRVMTIEFHRTRSGQLSSTAAALC